MNNVALILAMALITFGSRISFMWKPMDSAKVKDNSFLEVFPVSLFVVLATAGLAAPEGSLDISPALMAGVGGVAGAVLFKRSILAVVLGGLAFYWLARLAF